MTLAGWRRTEGDDHVSLHIKFYVCDLGVSRERQVRIHDLRLTEIIGAGVQGGADAYTQ